MEAPKESLEKENIFSEKYDEIRRLDGTKSAEPNSACNCSESERSETKISVYYPRVKREKDLNARGTVFYTKSIKVFLAFLEY
jgi:hypothetical protein